MEDIIIILLGLAAAAYSAFRKNKTEKQKDTQVSKSVDDAEGEPKDEGTDSDRDYLEELFGYSSSGQGPQSHPYSNDNRPGLYNDMSSDKRQERKSVSEMADALKRSQSTTTDKNKKSTYEKKTGSAIEETERKYKKPRSRGQKIKQRGFNLKEAVIYSEILNRKYS